MSDARPRLSLSILCVAAIAWALGQTTLIPAFPALMRELNCGPDEVAWTLTGYMVPAAVLTPTLGRLGDQLGRRRVLAWSLLVFASGCVVSALGESLALVVAGRVLQGAAGGIFPLSFGIIREQFPPERVARSIGLISALVGAGGGAGLLLGGLIVDHSSYHWIFWASAAMGVLACLGVAFVLPESRSRAAGSIDLRGAAMLALALSLLLLAVSRAASWGWTDPRLLALLATGFVLLGVWVRVQRRTVHPLANIPVLVARPVLLTNLATFLAGVGIFGSFVLIPQLVQAPVSSGYGLGLSATETGLVMLPGALVALVLGPVAGLVGGRVGSKVPLVLGAGIAATGLVLIAFVHDSALVVAGFAAMLYAGVGLCFAAMPNLIVEAVSPVQTSEMTGFNALVRTGGAAVGTQICASILAAAAVAGVASEASYTKAFLISAAAAAMAVIVGVAIPPSRRHFKPGIGEEIGAAAPLAEPPYVRE